MNLMSIQKDAQEIAASIGEMVGVDVVIVDDTLERVADTFHYPYSFIAIRDNSIIGRILHSGQPLVVDNRDYFPSCMDCKDRNWCKMQGLIGVPILFQGETIGAIGLVVEKRNVKHLLENVNPVLTFLQQMAGLLSGKLTTQASYAKVQNISFQWENMLDTMDSGMALVDEKNVIVVHNQRFKRLFHIEEDCDNHPLSDYVRHPLIDRATADREDVIGQTVVISLPQSTFCGQLNINQMWQDGVYRGAAYSFRDVSGLPSDDLLLYNSHGGGEPLSQACSDAEAVERLKRRLRDPRRRSEPLLLCGADQQALLRLAVSLHHAAGRTGGFVVIDGSGLYDSRMDGDVSGCFSRGLPNAMLRAHRGTLCVRDVFELPVFLQQGLLRCLRGRREDGQGGARESFQTSFIFLSERSALDRGPLFQEPELLEALLPYRVEVQDPLSSPHRLRAQLEHYLSHYGACYGIPEISLEPAALEELLTLPWDHENCVPSKVMEYLVRTCPDGIDRAAVHDLAERLRPSDRSVQDYEQKEIQRLLREGVSIDQIANILKISRSTLYRRIKKFEFKKKRREES